MFAYNLWWQDLDENAEKNTWDSPLIPGIYWVNFGALICQILGILGNPYVTIVYLLEQMNIFLLGSTSRASDMRIVMSFVIDLGFLVICHYVVGDNSSLGFVYGLLAYFTSRNIFFSLGLIKPFVVQNEELEK